MGPVLTKDCIYFLKCRVALSVSRWLYIFWLAAPKKSIWPPLYPRKSGCCKYKPVFISEDHTFELLPLRQWSRTGSVLLNRIYSKRHQFCSAKSNIIVLPGRRWEGKVLRSCFVMYGLNTHIVQVNHSQPGKLYPYYLPQLKAIITHAALWDTWWLKWRRRASWHSMRAEWEMKLRGNKLIKAT